MRTFLVAYDLIKPETSADYKTLIDYIKSLGEWAKPLESTWFVRTTATTTQVRDRLKAHADANDKLMVIDVTGVADWSTFHVVPEVAEYMQRYV